MKPLEKECANCWGKGVVRVKPSTLHPSLWRKPIPKITCPVCAGSGKVKPRRD